MTLSQRIVDSKDLAEALSYWATAFGIVIAVVAGLLAIARTFFEHRQERWARARDLYDNYMLLSIEYPQFYCDFWSNKKATRQDRESYISYVSYLLTAIEDIVTIDGRPEWRKSLISDLRPHSNYLASPEFLNERECYFGEVRELIEEVLREHQGAAHA
jgi:hypothetical protein